MNVLDILFAAVALLATLRSFFRGLVREVAAITGLLVGIWLAARHYPRLAAHIPWVGPHAAHVIAFVAVVAAVYALFALVSWVVRGALKVTLLGWLDRALGGVLGLAEAVLISAAVLLALIAFLPPGLQVVRHSRLAPRLYPVADRVSAFTPAELRQAYGEKKAALLRPEAPACPPVAPSRDMKKT
mgnify:FL=1